MSPIYHPHISPTNELFFYSKLRHLSKNDYDAHLVHSTKGENLNVNHLPSKGNGEDEVRISILSYWHCRSLVSSQHLKQ